MLIAICTALLLAGGSMLYLLARSGILRGPINKAHVRREGVPVAHGEVASSGDFEGHGKLYFVPMGRQAIPVEQLALLSAEV